MIEGKGRHEKTRTPSLYRVNRAAHVGVASISTALPKRVSAPLLTHAVERIATENLQPMNREPNSRVLPSRRAVTGNSIPEQTPVKSALQRTSLPFVSAGYTTEQSH